MQTIADNIFPVVREWLATCPGQPLIMRAVGDRVEVRVGLADDGSRITGAAAARILGVSPRTFSRRDFFGLTRGRDGRFSRLAVERLRDSRA